MGRPESGRVVLWLVGLIVIAVAGVIGTLFVLDWKARSDDEIRVIEVPFLGGAGALTAGRVIFVHEGRADDVDLLAHELVHVCQWEVGGLEFAWDYSTEYVSNLAELRDARQAYREVSFEEAARAGDSECDISAYALSSAR